MTATSPKTGPKGPRDRPDSGSKMDRLLTIIEGSETADLDTIRVAFFEQESVFPSASMVSKVYRYLSPTLRQRLFKLRYAREQAQCSHKHRTDRKARAGLNRSSKG